MSHAHQIERNGGSTVAGLSLAALILFGVRFVQGFIFWGGASRRLIYDFHDVAGVDQAVKLDFNGPGFVAAKLTHALPGALWIQAPDRMDVAPSRPHRRLGVDVDLRRACCRPWLDARAGDAPIRLRQHRSQRDADADFRLDGLDLPRRMDNGGVRRGDELGRIPCRRWRVVARCTLSRPRKGRIGQRVEAAGFSAGRCPTQRCVSWPCGSASAARYSRSSPTRSCLAPWYRRCIRARTSTATTSRCRRRRLPPTARVTFDAYVDAGPDTGAAYIVAATLLDGSGEKLAQWDGAALAALAPDAIRNVYPYEWASQFKTERIGFSGQTGATRDDHAAARHHGGGERRRTHPRARSDRRQSVARRRCHRQITLAAVVFALGTLMLISPLFARPDPQAACTC